MNERTLAHKLMKSAKYNQFPFEQVAKRFGVDPIRGRELISKYYGDLINPEFVTTREGLVGRVRVLVRHKPVLLVGPSGSGKTSIARQVLSGNIVEVDLADARTSEQLKEKLLQMHTNPENSILFENLDCFDGRSVRTIATVVSEATVPLIFTSRSKDIPKTVKDVVNVVDVCRPDIADVSEYISRKYPKFSGDIASIYDDCRGDMRRIVRFVEDGIISKDVDEVHTVPAMKACELVMYEEDREKVFRELHNLDNLYMLVQFLRQNIQYAYKSSAAADILREVDRMKFVVNKELTYSLLASIPTADKVLQRTYFPSFPRKKEKEDERPKLKKKREKSEVKKKPAKEVNPANDI